MSVGQELLNVPFAEMVQKLALAVAEGQTKLDTNSTEVAKFMATTDIKLPGIKTSDPDVTVPLIALGFYPSFYQVTTAEVEVKMAISMTKTRETSASLSVKGGWGPVSAQVNASYASKYSYSQEGSSRLYFKMAPTPPPALLEAYVQALIEERKKPLEQAIPEDNPAPAPSPAPN